MRLTRPHLILYHYFYILHTATANPTPDSAVALSHLQANPLSTQASKINMSRVQPFPCRPDDRTRTAFISGYVFCVGMVWWAQVGREGNYGTEV